MLLSDFIQYLVYGELSQYSFGTSNNGNIDEKDIPKLVSYINLGLTKLHTQLPLKMDSFLLRVNSNQERYKLHSSNAQSSGDNNGFILDSQNPFKNTLLRVEELFPEEGEPYPLNDSNDERSVYTPRYNELQFSLPKDELVAVTFRANHPTLPMARGIDPEELELDIPEACVEPLLTYCLARAVGMGGNAESIQESMMIKQRFDKQIVELSISGLIITDLPSRNTIWSDGWP